MNKIRIALLIVVLALTVYGLLKVDKAMRSHLETRNNQIQEILK